MINLLLYSLCSAIFFRIRGGLRIPKTDKRFPLCKWYFAIWFACLACILNGWEWQYFSVMAIATYMSTMIAGWGEACGCALGLAKPNPDRNDYLDIDEFCNNFHIGEWKLIDHAELYGVVWLTLRGLLLSFLIGLATNSVLYMLWGAPMGIIYWSAGWLSRNVRPDGKGGWYYAEWLYGFWLGLGCPLWRGDF